MSVRQRITKYNCRIKLSIYVARDSELFNTLLMNRAIFLILTYIFPFTQIIIDAVFVLEIGTSMNNIEVLIW